MTRARSALRPTNELIGTVEPRAARRGPQLLAEQLLVQRLKLGCGVVAELAASSARNRAKVRNASAGRPAAAWALDQRRDRPLAQRFGGHQGGRGGRGFADPTQFEQRDGAILDRGGVQPDQLGDCRSDRRMIELSERAAPPQGQRRVDPLEAERRVRSRGCRRQVRAEAVRVDRLGRDVQPVAAGAGSDRHRCGEQPAQPGDIGLQGRRPGRPVPVTPDQLDQDLAVDRRRACRASAASSRR